MKSLVLDKAFIIAIVFGDTFITLGRLPLAGLFIVIVQDFSSTSAHRSLDTSQPLAPVSFNTCRNVAVFLPQPAISWSISASPHFFAFQAYSSISVVAPAAHFSIRDSTSAKFSPRLSRRILGILYYSGKAYLMLSLK